MSSDVKTILVVDDDVDFLAQHRIALEAAGFSVLTAAGQGPAEELLKQVRPDLAIVDVMMEYKDSGFALCHHIKKKDATIPVILITSVANETGLEFDAATREERSWVKADAMLVKPVRIEQLLWEIQQLLKGE
jgi:DNA-binding response OmpR family regulator